MTARLVRVEDIEQGERVMADAEFVEEHGRESTWTDAEWRAYQQCMDAACVPFLPEAAA